MRWRRGNRHSGGDTAAALHEAVLNRTPVPVRELNPEVPPKLAEIINKALEKDREARYKTAVVMGADLEQLHRDTSGLIFQKHTVETSVVTRRRALTIAVAAVLVAVVASVLVIRFRTPQRPEPKHELVERQLTANSPESPVGDAAISRDGKYLAYSDYDYPKNLSLHLLAIDSGEIREALLPAHYDPFDWFPDGNHLLMQGYGGDLWKMSTWDFRLRKLWSGGLASAAAVSPDGSHIAFVNYPHELWLVGADGEEPQKIIAGDAQESVWGPVWSAKGQRLAYIRKRGTFAKPEVTIESCDLAGGAHTVVLSDPHMQSLDTRYGIAWLPDGRIIYSINSKSGDSDLWAIRADPGTGKPSGDATRLAGWKNFQAAYPQASADGKRLIAIKVRSESRIYVGDLPLGDKAFTPHRFTSDDWDNVVLDWTKDSKAIIFHSKRNGRWAIFKQDIDAKTPESLISGVENYFLPKLSAQGTLLYTATASPDRYEPGDTTIRLMSTPEQGGARSTLMVGRYTYACGSSPSSSCVVAELKDGLVVFFHLDPVNGRGEEIARLAGYQSGKPLWDLSPDGSRLAIVDQGQDKGEIRILNLADRRFTVLSVRNWKSHALQCIGWAADGKSLFALARSEFSFALLSVDANGNPRVLQEIPAGAGWISSIVPSPDGKRLAFTKRVYPPDVMLLENF
jgi:Tol biopolymer transport system component